MKLKPDEWISSGNSQFASLSHLSHSQSKKYDTAVNLSERETFLSEKI